MRRSSAVLVARSLAALAFALHLLAQPEPLVAQSSAGVGDDAVPVPARGSRIRIGGLWSSYDQRFAPSTNGGSKKGGLYDGFARESFGVADLPTLAPAESNIRGLSGLASFSLSLGGLEAQGDASKSVVPFQLDLGITNRLFVTVVVPYVETTSNSRFVLNRGGQGASVGINPARATSSARSANTTVVQQIATSRIALTAEIARCANVAETGGGCTAIRANPTGALALLADAATFGTQLGALYGTSEVAGAPVVPISQSTVQKAIEDRLAGFRTQFIGFGSNTLDATSRPVGATSIYGSTGLQALAQDSAFGLAHDSLANGGRAGMGDIDVAATFLWLNTGSVTQYDRLNLSRRALRSSVTGGFRFGTATGGRSGSPFDLPTGDGASAILVKSTTDFVWDRTKWVSGTVRYIKPLSDNVVTRFPVIGDSTLFRPFIELAAERSLGARTEIEIAPRFGIGRSFALSAAYTLSRQGESTLRADELNLVDPLFTGFGPSTYSAPALTFQAVQFGAAYSTLSAFSRGNSRWPLEIVYSHGLTLAGSGGIVPAASFDRIELRIYTRFPRR
ncbi:MAG: hypothetical protein H7Z40_11050 [Phycisphaerae bacterium]|nr:hypothetical protein [Gemmatimonadaceae bacterium]